MLVHLEDGLFRLCGELIQNDIEFQKTAVNKNFNKVDDSLFREYRNHRFKKTINYAYNNSIFYKKLFDDNNIMSFISKLRKKVEPDADHPFYILTVHGVGYRFNKEA